jgi:hypothetical protein
MAWLATGSKSVMQQKRRDERGGFEKRIKLLWTE